MNKRVLLQLALLLILFLPAPLLAQGEVGVVGEEVPRGEVGFFYEFGHTSPNGNFSIHGVGGRFTLNATRWFALETTFGWDPSRSGLPVRFAHQEFAGKLTWRRGRAGLFGFIGPGYINGRAFGFSETRTSLRWGGGFEFYPSRRVGFRIDVGDLVVFFPGNTTHSFFLKPGISIRF